MIVERRHGFTLIELLVVIAIIALLIGILIPTLGRARNSARSMVCAANLRSLGTSSANYASDYDDTLFTFSWKGGATYTVVGETQPVRVPVDQSGGDLNGAAWQQADIIRRRTGRLDFPVVDKRLAHRRYSHLVLFDYLTAQLPEPVGICPMDRNQQLWAEDPELAEQQGILPYQGTFADGSRENSGYDLDADWAQTIPLWPYASSYQMVPASWNPDRLPGTYVPSRTSSNRFDVFTTPEANGRVPLGGRRYGHVAFPSQKVHLFEEYDRLSDPQGAWYAYEEASCNLLFFDGSVSRRPTKDSNAGWSPAAPNTLFRHAYTPLDKFPIWIDGNKDRLLLVRYRWTREGLKGVDFGGREINVPDTVTDHPQYPRGDSSG